ncbi:elongator complex protein 5-like [Lytechinus pictus]|uniref:elongator complex protein 5-like n=1 Tax=Lytechinus pictus TaxID=7653 RepID=UPI0030BA2228
MTSLLKQVLTGSEKSCAVTIHDTVEHSGRYLLKCFLKEMAERVDEIHLFAFDHAPDALLAGTDPETRRKVKGHDGWTDPQGWNSDRNMIPSNYNTIHLTSEKGFVDHIKERKEPGSGQIAVVIDSLTPYILHRSAPFTCKSLHALTHLPEPSEFQVTQVVSLIHSDVHDESVLRAIGHLSSTVIHVSANMSIAPLDREPMGYCDIQHKRSSGKVLQKREGYSIGDSYQLITFLGLPSTNTTEPDQQPDPTANLTFNLTLSESEKKARENVVLPFTKVSNNSTTGSGQIFYEPDQVDDYDDEDPDDDLDI